ncbi:MAG TPA: periplasmic heavy metal sensor [Thermodesulfovibrionia bacterium]|nr:periplasmic heavy metal sensor [Thermodesulfovibrionia bacterium]
MKKVVLITGLISWLMLAAASAMAQGPDMDDSVKQKLPQGKWWNNPEIAQKLTLTDEEKAKLNELFKQNRMQMITLKGDLEKEKLTLEDMFDAENFDSAACMEQFKKFQEAKTKLGAERFRFVVEVRKLLGKDRFLQLKAEFPRYRTKIKRGANP